MDQQLTKIECAPECGFSVQSHDEQEVMDMAKSHSKNKHNKDITLDELKLMIKNV